MPAMSSQTINTLVLLLLLGVLIYFLQSPCDNEGFADVKKAPAPSNMRRANVNTVNTVDENDVKKQLLDQMMKNTEKPVATPQQRAAHGAPQRAARGGARGGARGAAHGAAHGGAQEGAHGAAPGAAPGAAQGAMPDEYDPFDPAGANLEFAFEDANSNPAAADMVDMNNKNQKNYCAGDFLPKENNPEWWDDGFSQAKYNLNDDKLINTERYIIGINTVGQSLKNASYDIRGTVPNPKFSVSPWNNSTVEADYNIKSLC